MQMIFGGRNIGASKRTDPRGETSSGGGFSIHSSIRALAAGPPAITSNIEAKPSDFRLTTWSFQSTPGSLAPLRRKVTNFIARFQEGEHRIVSLALITLFMNPLDLFALKGKVAVVLGGTSG